MTILLVLSSLGFAVSTTVVSMTPASGSSDHTGTTVYYLDSTDLSRLSTNNGIQGIQDPINRYVIRGLWSTSYDENAYLEFLFHSCGVVADLCLPPVPYCSVVTDADMTVDWSKFCNMSSARLLVWDSDAGDGGEWVEHALTIPTSNFNDVTNNIDIYSYISTPSEANDLKAKFQAAYLYDRLDARTFHDLVQADISYALKSCDSYSGSEECTSYNYDERCPECQWCSECSGNKYTDDRCIHVQEDCGYACLQGECGAECDSDDDCDEAMCEGNHRHLLKGCDLDDCGCLYYEEYEDCDDYDGWYETEDTRTVDYGQCETVDQRKWENRDYYCAVEGCAYTVVGTEWRNIDGTITPKPDGTACDDDEWCSVNDECYSGICTPMEKRDCSDGNECTDDICDDYEDECENPPVQDGTECGEWRECLGDSCSNPFWYDYPDSGHDFCSGGACVEWSCGYLSRVCDKKCGASCESDRDCDQTFQCTCDKIYQTRTGTCDTLTTCDCSYTGWQDGTCEQSYDICDADCYDDSHCTETGLIGDYCQFNPECNCECSCDYDTDYCPPSGTEYEDVCYWGERACEPECTLNEEEMCSEEECTEQGPIDSVGPVVSNLNAERQCKEFSITSTATDGCSNVAGAEFEIDICPSGDGYPMEASDENFDEPQEDVESEYDAEGLGSGTYAFYVHAKDDFGNWGDCVSEEFCVDSEAPVTVKTYGTPFYEESMGDIMNGDGKHYITSETPITLTPSDDDWCDDSAVAGTWYNYTLIYMGDIDVAMTAGAGTNWVPYTTPFTIAGPEGVYEICFYSEDNYCNVEEMTCQEVIVDNSPPETEKIVTGSCNCQEEQCDDYDYLIFEGTNYTFQAEDSPAYNSGVHVTYYRTCEYENDEQVGEDMAFVNQIETCDYECGGEWEEYYDESDKFSITGEDGLYYVEYYSVDNLGNMEEKKCEIDMLDNTPANTTPDPEDVPGHTEGSTQVDDFTIPVEDTSICPTQSVCTYRIYNGPECGGWTGWMERECNADLLVETGECCPDPCRCGVKDITVQTKIVDCLGREATGQKTYTIDVVNPPATLVGTSGTYTGPDVELVIDTNKPSICRFDVVDRWFDNMAYEMETENNLHHTYMLEELDDGEYIYYYRCQDMIGNTMPWALPIMFTVDSDYVPESTTTTSTSTTVVQQTSGNSVSYSYSYSGGSGSKTTTTKTTTTTAAGQGASVTTTTVEEEETETTTTTVEEPVLEMEGAGEEGGTSPMTGFVTSISQEPAPLLGVITAIIAIALLLIL